MTATPISMHVIDGHSLDDTARVIQSHVIAMYAPSLVSGYLTDRLGERRMMIAGALTLLACAGLKRAGLADRITSPIPTEEILPAVAQGAIGVESRADDLDVAQLLAPINDQATALVVTMERAFLAGLDGSCRTPIAGLAELAGDRLTFRGMILTPDGTQCHITAREGRPEEAIRLAEDAAAELLCRAGPEFFRVLT